MKAQRVPGTQVQTRQDASVLEAARATRSYACALCVYSGSTYHEGDDRLLHVTGHSSARDLRHDRGHRYERKYDTFHLDK